jgi:hypothetical protein
LGSGGCRPEIQRRSGEHHRPGVERAVRHEVAGGEWVMRLEVRLMSKV